MARGIAKGDYENDSSPARNLWAKGSNDVIQRYEALVEVGDGSQWTITAQSMSGLIREAQDIIGRDLRGEKYYVRYVNVNGRFDVDALNELMAGLRG